MTCSRLTEERTQAKRMRQRSLDPIVSVAIGTEELRSILEQWDRKQFSLVERLLAEINELSGCRFDGPFHLEETEDYDTT